MFYCCLYIKTESTVYSLLTARPELSLPGQRLYHTHRDTHTSTASSEAATVAADSSSAGGSPRG